MGAVPIYLSRLGNNAFDEVAVGGKAFSFIVNIN
jgi:hypothetical protein